jgi:hypothetical protein
MANTAGKAQSGAERVEGSDDSLECQQIECSLHLAKLSHLNEKSIDDDSGLKRLAVFEFVEGARPILAEEAA